MSEDILKKSFESEDFENYNDAIRCQRAIEKAIKLTREKEEEKFNEWKKNLMKREMALDESSYYEHSFEQLFKDVEELLYVFLKRENENYCKQNNISNSRNSIKRLKGRNL